MPPRPSRSLILCSLVALALCAVLCALCTAVMLHPWGIRSFGGLLLLPGILGLGLTQYAGTFQAKLARAEMVARLYSFACGFMLIALACLLFDIARSGQHPSWPVIAVGAVFVVFAVWGRIGSRLNREWADTLRQFEEEEREEQDTESSSKPIHRRYLMVWLATSTVFFVATGTFYWALGPQSGEHAARDATPLILPDGSSDVSYWIYAGNTVFEFAISEQEFLQWAEPQIRRRDDGFEGMEAPKQAAKIPTYRAWLPDAPQPHDAIIQDGYYHAIEQGSKTIRYAYDLKEGKAYYAAISERRSKRNPEP